jgi:nucleoside-diphosphate-sugar epimerase
VYVPYSEVYGQGIEDTLHREPSIDRIGAAIGWRPRIGLDRILRDVVGSVRAKGVVEPADAPAR